MCRSTPLKPKGGPPARFAQFGAMIGRPFLARSGLAIRRGPILHEVLKRSSALEACLCRVDTSNAASSDPIRVPSFSRPFGYCAWDHAAKMTPIPHSIATAARGVQRPTLESRVSQLSRGPHPFCRSAGSRQGLRRRVFQAAKSGTTSHPNLTWTPATLVENKYDAVACVGCNMHCQCRLGARMPLAGWVS